MVRATSLAVVPGPTTATATASTGSSATALAPGFRFHPTDEELVFYYLKRKVTNKSTRFNAIAEVDIYRHEPWNLSDKSRLKTRDQEWYFFSLLDRKYGNGGRVNRATKEGYWKATGKDREVRHDSQIIGMKKTLVFHSGKAPGGLRTDWVMHEYRLVEEESERRGALQGYVLCRVIHKNNIGPPNGNRYAPFVEADWDDSSAALIPGVDTEDDVVAGNDLTADDDVVAGNDLTADDDDVAGNDLTADDDVLAAGTAVTESNGIQRIGSEQDIQYLDEDAPPGDGVPGESPNERTGDCIVLPPCKIERSDDGPPPHMLNRDTPLPILSYKRKMHNDLDLNHANVIENSTRMTQDRWSSTTIARATTTSPSPPSATTTAVSALLEFSLMESIEPKENPPPKYNTTTLDSMVPLGCMKLINELHNEIHKISVERETLKLDMMSAQAMIKILQSRINSLIEENADLKRSNRDM